MKAIRQRTSAAEWGEIVTAWESSGLSAEAFASERGIAEGTLRWWKTELARRARNEVRRRPPRSGRVPTAGGGGISLARVVREGDAATSKGHVAIVVGSARILVDREFDPQLLRDVVQALGDRR